MAGTLYVAPGASGISDLFFYNGGLEGTLQRIALLEEDMNLVIFELAMNGLLEGARNVFIDRITSPNAVIIHSGIYGNNKAYI